MEPWKTQNYQRNPEEKEQSNQNIQRNNARNLLKLKKNVISEIAKSHRITTSIEEQ